MINGNEFLDADELPMLLEAGDKLRFDAEVNGMFCYEVVSGRWDGSVVVFAEEVKGEQVS